MFRHFGGFLVFHFRDEIVVSNFLRNCPVVIDKCVFKVKSWHEFFPDNLDNLENEKVRIWVKFTRVPFIYWTIKGLCMLGFVVDDLIGMDKSTHRAAVRNEPNSEARMLTEIGVLDPVKHFILVNSYVVNKQSRVLLNYESPTVCRYCCGNHVGECELIQECFKDMGEEPLDFRMLLEDYDDSGYRDHVPTSDSDAEDPRLENAEFDSDPELDYLED
ncbi:hypothetical protein POM88_049751 [Heracleum sosnowskyi]|uniref:DUF4283 domain-containing protein n=1 Tax=Heracleum sosnowskyi TaxID=360622 RepID=A0AAD8GWA0_9APIA|nr:hypothetical protein POM88_049751 [Heracleum sosnowskyi]